jgi:hypothetical protein
MVRLTLRRVESGNLADVPSVPINLITALFLGQRVEALAIVADCRRAEWLVQSV